MESQTTPADQPLGFIDGGTLELSSAFTSVATALAKAQAAFPGIEKNRVAQIRSEKGNYEFHYADLASVLSAVTPALTKEGISLLQPVTNAGGEVRVQTWLLHGESGQWIRSKVLSLTLTKDRPAKELGIAITYLRRYQVGALLGIAPEEDLDDGESQTTPRQEQRRAPPAPALSPQEALARTPGGAEPIDHVAVCREALEKGDWVRFLATISKVRNTVTREQLQKEYQTKRGAERKNGATTTPTKESNP
jgi:hypothetical protein